MQINQDLLGTIPSDISGLKGQILWTNPNPNVAFAGNEEIELSSNDYDFLIWITTGFKVGYDNGVSKTFITTKDFNHWNMDDSSGVSGTSINIYYRYVDKKSDTKYFVSQSYHYTQQGGATSWQRNDNNLIPIYIIGFKTGIFEA